MELLKMASSTYQSVTRFAKFERVLAAVCIFIPLFLILFDGRNVRDNISAYYDMTQHQWFYFLLTVASMLFVVNGVVKQRYAYNIVLGVLLAGVLLFNHCDHKVIHYIFAAGFFLGNAAVILTCSSKHEVWFKSLLVVIIAITIAACFFGWITLFYAEWVSLIIIGWHYILESWGVTNQPNPCIADGEK